MKRVMICLMVLLLTCGGCVNNEIPTKGEGATNLRVFSDGYIGELLALDVQLVGAPQQYISPLWQDKLVHTVDTADNLERVIATNPDLIITMFPEKKAQYQQIAQTVVIPYGTLPTRELLRELAKQTGTQARAEQWIQAWDAAVSQVKQSLPTQAREATYSIYDVWATGIYVFGDNWAHGGEIIFKELELRPSEGTQKELLDAQVDYLQIAVESVPQFAGDVIIYFNESQRSDNLLTTSVLYQTLPAVQQQQVIELNPSIYMFADPLSLMYQLSEIEERIHALFT